MKKALLVVALFPFFGSSQSLNIKKTQSGLFSLGVRSTVSTFNGGESANNGLGVGGQFRLQLADRINTEWYADYIQGNLGDYASRTDYHIGWSVMYYFTDKPNPLLKPYFVVGHCFDGTKLMDNTDRTNSVSKKSSAVQAGLGFHLNLSERMDLSFNTQYMIHLGGDVHAHYEDNHVHFEKVKGTGLEGHLLFHIGINYKIADLW